MAQLSCQSCESCLNSFLYRANDQFGSAVQVVDVMGEGDGEAESGGAGGDSGRADGGGDDALVS